MTKRWCYDKRLSNTNEHATTHGHPHAYLIVPEPHGHVAQELRGWHGNSRVKGKVVKPGLDPPVAQGVEQDRICMQKAGQSE